MTEREHAAVVVGPVGLDHLPRCLEIRRAVFIETQGVPEDLELDGLDATSTHFLAWRDEVPIGTARLRTMGDAAKAERVAVLATAEGQGVGRRLMDSLERQAAVDGATRVVLNAQEQVVPFYEKLGYRAAGDLFVEAGIQHRAMSKNLRSR